MDKPMVPDETVKKATNKTWNEWVVLLDSKGAEKMTHSDIVKTLAEKDLIESSWWRQMVANGYERLKGKRVLGQTTTQGFEVGAQRTMPISGDKAWKLITSNVGRKEWLGTAQVTLSKGETFKTLDGVEGEIRVVNKQKNIRVFWKPRLWKRHSILQVRVESRGDKSVVGFHHEHLPNAKARKVMLNHWQAVLQKLATMVPAS